MSQCPFCHRQLLSHNSPNCSWCGREIPDADYQNQAAIGRQAFLTEQTMHDVASLARLESIPVSNPFGDPWLMPLNPLGILPLMAAAQIRPVPGRLTIPSLAPSSAPAQEDEDSTTEKRFRHLEL